MLALSAVLLPLASYVPTAPRSAVAHRSAHAVRLAAAPLMAETVLVTDSTDSFYGSRSLFQSLFDHGDYSKVVAFSSSVVDAKKMVISRQARYSGLIDVLDFKEGGDAELAAALGDVSTWVAVNADEAALPAQVAAAGSAGVKRIFIHLNAADAAPGTADALKSALDACGATYTVMRTGSLSKTGAGGGLLVGDLDMPTCDEVPIDDAFRVLVEAIALPELAGGRLFSLCPSVDNSQLRAMRMSGCSRTEEVSALLKGVIVEKLPEDRAADAVAAEELAKKEIDPRSDEEIAAAAEEEVKMLLQRAREKGVANQKRMVEEEAEKKVLREERMKLYSVNTPTDEDGKGIAPGEQTDSKGGGDKKGGDKDGGDGDDKPKEGGDDDDGLQPA